MVRIRYALAAALLALAGWLVCQGYLAGWQPARVYEQIGITAFDWGLAGLAATCYARAADVRAHELRRMSDPASDRAVRSALVHDRMVTARILASVGRSSSALVVAEGAHGIDPSNRGAQALMWRLRYICGSETAAKRELMLLADRTDAPELLAALGACLVDEGAGDAAQKLLERALEKDTRLSEGWLHLARIFRSQGNRSDALRAAMKAWQSSADQPAIRYRAAQMILRMGARQSGFTIVGESIDYYRRAGLYWMQRYRNFLVAVGLYVVFLFWPALSGALRAGHRDPLGG